MAERCRHLGLARCSALPRFAQFVGVTLQLESDGAGLRLFCRGPHQKVLLGPQSYITQLPGTSKKRPHAIVLHTLGSTWFTVGLAPGFGCGSPGALRNCQSTCQCQCSLFYTCLPVSLAPDRTVHDPASLRLDSSPCFYAGVCRLLDQIRSTPRSAGSTLQLPNAELPSTNQKRQQSTRSHQLAEIGWRG